MERRESILLLLIAVVAFMDCLDGSIINVALPTISDQLSIDMASASWFTISYFAMMAGLLILFGRIANNTSIRKVLISGLVIFIISSFVCGIAESFEVLLIARIVQGTGAAMMGATVPMACVKFFSPRILAFAFAFITIGYSGQINRKQIFLFSRRKIYKFFSHAYFPNIFVITLILE